MALNPNIPTKDRKRMAEVERNIRSWIHVYTAQDAEPPPVVHVQNKDFRLFKKYKPELRFMGVRIADSGENL